MAETTEPTTEIWYSPSAKGMKVGPGNPADDINRTPDPWDVLRFRDGFLTIDTGDKHYPEWKKWLTVTAPAYPGLRVVTQAERDVIEHVATDQEWRDISARHEAAMARRR